MSASAMHERPLRWPWIAFGLFLAIAACASVVVRLNGESLANQVSFIVAFSMFGLVGAMIVSRDRRNRVGVLLLYGSFVSAIGFFAGEMTTYLAAHGTTEGPLVVAMGLAGDLGWIVGILPVLYLLPLLFPDGRPPSPRWRPLVWAVLGFLGLLTLAFPLGVEAFEGSSGQANVPNPFYVPAVEGFGISDAAFNLVLLGLLGGSVVSILVRFRRSRGVERQQIKWVAFSVSLLLAAFAASGLLPALGVESTLVDGLLVGPAFLSLPVTIGIAVLQFHLYDLDVVVKKALVAGSLALVAILVYGAMVYLVGRVTTASESSGWVFAIALVLGLTFRPVARFARRLADRLVYGRRATPYEVLTEFSERVGDAYATEDVLGRMATILGEGVGAETARVWLHVGDELRPSSGWPAEAPARAVLRAPRGALPEIAGETAVEVRDGGELLGALSVGMRPNDPMTPAKERLVHDLASQAGLVLRNVRLVEELRASQRRIVAAQDHERRRIERNIHDGAQQQLVALTVKMRLAQSLATRDGEETAAMLEQLQAETQTALEDLRDLARGIYPPLLQDQGLAAAVEAQLRKTATRAEFAPDGLGRYQPEVEAAVYFSVLEALQNVGKYAQADRTRVALGQHDGWLTFTVEDDGRGFDPAAAGHGTGLQGMADRLGALGGSMEVSSVPGEGTVVTGRVPAEPR